MIRFLRRRPFPLKKGRRPAQHVPEEIPLHRLRSFSKTGSDKTHGKSVAGKHGNPAGIIADKFPQPASYVGSGVAVIRKSHDTSRVLPFYAQKICYAVH